MSVSPDGAPYVLELDRRVLKQMEKLESQEQAEVWRALATMCAEGRGNIKAMKAEFKGALRLSLGHLRIVFVQSGQTLTVLRIGHRKDVYR